MSKLLQELKSRAKRQIIPTTKGNIIVREFLLRELKHMIDIQEMEDQTAAMVHMLDIINGCIETEGVTMQNLPSVDTELVYLALHRMTKGDLQEMALHCGHCDKEFETTINLSLVVVDGEHKKQIKLDGGLILNMRSPTMIESLIVDSHNNQVTDQVFNLAMRCIVSVDTGTETMVVGEDLSPDDLKEVVEYLSERGFVALVEFIHQIPTIKIRQPVKCPHCQAADVLTLHGLHDIVS